MFADTWQALARVALLGAVLSGCGGGMNAGETVRPDAPSASNAIADTVACAGVRSYAEPLVVDWSTSSRTDLEVAMKQGVAVVHYDCDELRLVNGCRLPANYAFAGVSLKEELIRMDNADEVQANLPVSGVKISAGMNAASALDLALVMVGKRSTTLIEADPSMLDGSCAGATHFVRAATIGAFAMDRSSSGKVRAAADLFGAGVDAASRSDRSNVTRDGDRNACRKGKASDETAPMGCGAALRLELIPLTKRRKPEEADAKEAKPAPEAGGASLGIRNPQEECPVDTIWKNTKCASATAEERLCFRGNLPACQDLCERGDGWGCTTAGEHLIERVSRRARERADADSDPRSHIAPANEMFERGCKLRDEKACALRTYYGLLASQETDLSSLATLGEASCQRGGAVSCQITAILYEPESSLRRDRELTAPPASQTRYVMLMQRSCDLGHNKACSQLARRLMREEATKSRGLALLERACEGGYDLACQTWAAELDRANEPAAAAEARALACIHGREGWDCRRAADLFHESPGVPRDPDRALTLARRGCALRDGRSCSFLVDQGSEADRHRALQRSCDPSREWIDARLCLNAADDSLKRAMQLDREACEKGDAPACERQATRQLALACSQSMASSCTRLKARDPAAYREVIERQCREDRDAVREGRLVLPVGGVQKSIPCQRAEKEGIEVP